MKIPVGLSNHHVHVTREVGYILFGNEHELTLKRELKQIGEFACEETVDVIINGIKLEHVRLIGPYRKYTQVELLDKDCDLFNVEHVRKNSGEIENTIPFTLVGPNGEYSFDTGAFIANNHLHFSKEELEQTTLKKGDIGVENATKADIIEAINKSRPEIVNKSTEFSKDDLVNNGLSGAEDSSKRREKLGEGLGIGYSNAKQLLNRLNNFGITREEFNEALERLD